MGVRPILSILLIFAVAIDVVATSGASTTAGGSTATGASTAAGDTTATGASTAAEDTTATGASTASGGSTATDGSTAAGDTTATGASTTVAGSTATDGSTTAEGSTATGASTAVVGSTATDGSTTVGGSTATGGSATTDGPTTAGGMTTSVAATTTAIPPTTIAAPPVVVIAAVIVQPFVPQLSDPTSNEFKALEAEVVAVYDVIYKAEYGLLFIRSYVITFRAAVTRTRADNTEAEVGIEFNTTASPSEIPQADDVAKTLVDVISNPNSTFNLSIDTSSIKVIEKNTTVTTNSTTSPTNTSAANTTTNATTTTTTTAATTTTAEAVTTKRMTFRSAGETFTSDLQDSSSQAFITRASLIKTTLEPFYQSAFSSFRSLTVTAFSNGSIINTADLAFSSTSVPNDTEIANTLVNAASNITAFNIDTTSISVDGSQVSSGVSHKISLITASFLVLLSWLLSSQQ